MIGFSGPARTDPLRLETFNDGKYGDATGPRQQPHASPTAAWPRALGLHQQAPAPPDGTGPGSPARHPEPARLPHRQRNRPGSPTANPIQELKEAGLAVFWGIV